ncbi:biotin--[acetyl-CoA-carboxylase] ligase [Sphingomonas sp. 2R-10]|uniref:biotin--[acetyl-CoA-carboxylase] ligase n=1 Tax=Sphingomonas sp. 2R-10 TaxID=3045148 RepID=UPI000F7B1E76|nr:biotin--[acetyl-CoA-carboxylase] ligase [Sphingomonas sp. 2R-10]MDJ0277007.1 biotin--[acetyl-CoA-carboxylase] ligase [Sphingomonas sp. 2R-10]
MVADRSTGAVLTVRVVGETGSTNADLLAAAEAGAEEGLWLRAERQIAGRGRLGRSWSDGRGNLFASTIVRLQPDDPLAPTLTLVAAVALAEAVASVAPARVTIKWPNDLLIGGAKLSGILLERGGGNAVVIGFGVNLASHPGLADRPTTSLHAQGIDVTPGAMLDRLRARFAAWLTVWRRHDLSAIRTAWEALAHPRGTPLRVRLPDGGEREGAFDGLDVSGALRLWVREDAVLLVHAGDVFA